MPRSSASSLPVQTYPIYGLGKAAEAHFDTGVFPPRVLYTRACCVMVLLEKVGKMRVQVEPVVVSSWSKRRVKMVARWKVSPVTESSGVISE